MICRNALYDFVESTIQAAGPDNALYDAISFRSLRDSVDEHWKVVRVECFDGDHSMSVEDAEKEQNVRAVIQCWVIPDGTEKFHLDEAADLSFDMSRGIFEAIAFDPGLNGRVCLANFREFETGEASLGTMTRGVTYLWGDINPANEG